MRIEPAVCLRCLAAGVRLGSQGKTIDRMCLRMGLKSNDVGRCFWRPGWVLITMSAPYINMNLQKQLLIEFPFSLSQ
jgi:hypothetical protein